MLRVEFAAASSPDAVRVVAASAAQELLAALGASVSQAVDAVAQGRRASLDVFTPGAAHARVIVLKRDDRPHRFGGRIAGALTEAGATEATLVTDDVSAAAVAEMAFGAALRCYRFDRYRTKTLPGVERLTWITDDPGAAQAAYESRAGLAAGVFAARDLSNEPANVLSPSAFAARAADLARLGLNVEIIDTPELIARGLNGLVAVGQGSTDSAKLALIEWRGAQKGPTICVVGKGITYDSGGLSLKTYAGVEFMNFDMGGAACVFGLMEALARSKAPARVIGALALAENMPSGSAVRPGDVIRCYDGRTVEVKNTDAEGRIVLGDAIAYCRERYAPDVVIDVATLTGVCVRSLGYDYAGLLSNSDALADLISRAGDATGERVWRLPLDPAFAAMNHSDVADISNLPWDRNNFFAAGVSTAAHFIESFVGDTPWGHLDIAGPAFPLTQAGVLAPAGAPGYGVMLLDRVVRELAGGADYARRPIG